MKISERKKHLRRRGVVPVAQEQEARAVKATSASTERKSATYTAGARPAARGSRAAVKGDANRAAARPRRQMGSGYQLTIGALYTVFAPLLLAFYIVQLRDPKLKTHPGGLEILLTVLFFLFGVWNLYRGLQARRRRPAAGAESPAPDAGAPLKRPRALKSSSS